MVPKDRLHQHCGLQVTLYNIKEHHFKTYNVETKPVRLLHKQEVLIDIKLTSTFHFLENRMVLCKVKEMDNLEDFKTYWMRGQ